MGSAASEKHEREERTEAHEVEKTVVLEDVAMSTMYCTICHNILIQYITAWIQYSYIKTYSNIALRYV